jgi:3-oxoacyl-[acyl-carrier protein] reductase
MEKDLKNKVALITGASRGIGRATAQIFSQHGAKVAINYHSNEAAAQTTLESLTGEGHMVIKADISQASEAQRCVDQVVEKLGKIDVLVNNAGTYELHPLALVDYKQWQESWHRIINLNLLGAAYITFCVAQHMIEQGGGRIVNVTSRGAFRGEPKSPAYGASKAGLNSMSQSLAQALAPHKIYVYAVAPGWVETDLSESYLLSPDGEAIRNQSPLGRVAKPEEVARTILFLASEGSEFLTGGIVDINGASYLRS